MKAWTKVLVVLVLSFSFLFTCVGYAVLTDELNIAGEIEVSEPKSLYIKEISSVTGSTTAPAFEIASYTVVRSSVTLGSNGSDTVEMSITVKNNTTSQYGFNAIRYTLGDQTFSNSNISVKTDMKRKTIDNKGVESGTKIEPGATHTFTAVFSHKDGVPSADLSLYSLINYEFLPWDQITADVDAGVASDALGRFEEILNNKESNERLVEQIQNNEAADRYSPDYIANFDSANAADKALIEELFGTDSLKVVIDGVETEVRMIIKMKDITDLYSGDEFTVYLTTHSLEKSGWGTVYASPIYAAVYTTNADETWSMISDMYTGRGRINGYDGSYFGSGSFDTDSWRSTQEYHGVATNSTIEQVISASLTQTNP